MISDKQKTLCRDILSHTGRRKLDSRKLLSLHSKFLRKKSSPSLFYIYINGDFCLSLVHPPSFLAFDHSIWLSLLICLSLSAFLSILRTICPIINKMITCLYVVNLGSSGQQYTRTLHALTH